MPSTSLLGSYMDTTWCSRTKFGSGIAKTLVHYIDAHCGGDVSVELNYAQLSEELEFSEHEIRQAVGHLIAHGFARIETGYRWAKDDVLQLLTPGRRAEMARLADEAKAREERKAMKIALRGGRVSRAVIPATVRVQVYARDGHACLHCGSREDLSLDHIHPWSLGGPDTVDNLQTLCRPCNSRKGDQV
ncbi:MULTISPECIES: HNH endonuclease [Streptomyces]|uniref:HNH endonuclease n=1 Tax=Streptomyces TaxID=1883 RepID=UPI0006AE41C6|nr:HNH endonuclease [Streptomyces sp. XY533]KOV07480.1 hypothetical protein ADK92_05515 [Streptomyces sp. XY533]